MADINRPTDSIREAMAFGRRMSRMLDDALGFEVRRPESWDEVWRPPVDLVETERDFVFRVEVPGISRDAVQVEADQRTLTIRGEKRYTRETGQQRFHRMECSYGMFERRFSLPVDIDPDQVQARLEDGILTVRVPKKDEHVVRRIEIGG